RPRRRGRSPLSGPACRSRNAGQPHPKDRVRALSATPGTVWRPIASHPKEGLMGTPRTIAAITTAAVLALTPAAALAANKPPTAHATCVALQKKEGVKKFDARFGTGTKHTGARGGCVKLPPKAPAQKQQ